MKQNERLQDDKVNKPLALVYTAIGVLAIATVVLSIYSGE